MQKRKRLKVAAAIIISLMTIGALGPIVYYRLTYHTFAWWEVPSEINYCGREYLRGSTISALPTQGWSITQVMTVYPEGWQVYAKQPQANGEVDSAIPGLPCTMGLVLKQGNDSFVQYGLSGGP